MSPLIRHLTVLRQQMTFRRSAHWLTKPIQLRWLVELVPSILMFVPQMIEITKQLFRLFYWSSQSFLVYFCEAFLAQHCYLALWFSHTLQHSVYVHLSLITYSVLPGETLLSHYSPLFSWWHLESITTSS